MSEFKFKPPDKQEIQELKQRLEHLAFRAETRTRNMVADTKFKLAVPKELREEGQLKSEVFAKELVDFLQDNTGSVLQPLSPTQDDVGLVDRLIRAAEEGRIKRRRQIGKINPYTQRALLHTFYSADGPIFESDRLITAVFGFVGEDQINLHVGWEVNRQFPQRASIWGWVGTYYNFYSPRLSFMFFPAKPVRPSDIEEAIGRIQTKDMEEIYGVYGDGKRVDITGKWIDKGREHEAVEKFYLLGSFESEGTGQTYWVYGSIEERFMKRALPEGIGELELASQGVKV